MEASSLMLNLCCWQKGEKDITHPKNFNPPAKYNTQFFINLLTSGLGVSPHQSLMGFALPISGANFPAPVAKG